MSRFRGEGLGRVRVIFLPQPCSQVPAQKSQYAKVPYFGVLCPDPHQMSFFRAHQTEGDSLLWDKLPELLLK